MNSSQVRAPTRLPASQRKRIDELISSKPDDWFQVTDMPLLIELARHMDRADRIDKEVRATEKGDLAGLKWVQQLANAESTRIQSLMRSLRLTPQARYRPDAVKLKGRRSSPVGTRKGVSAGGGGKTGG